MKFISCYFYRLNLEFTRVFPIVILIKTINQSVSLYQSPRFKGHCKMSIFDNSYLLYSFIVSRIEIFILTYSKFKGRIVLLRHLVQSTWVSKLSHPVQIYTAPYYSKSNYYMFVCKTKANVIMFCIKDEAKRSYCIL